MRDIGSASDCERAKRTTAVTMPFLPLFDWLTLRNVTKARVYKSSAHVYFVLSVRLPVRGGDLARDIRDTNFSGTYRYA